MTSVYALQFCFFKLHFNINLPSMSGSAKWSFPQPFPPKPYCVLLFHVCNLSFLSHIPIFLDMITLVAWSTVTWNSAVGSFHQPWYYQQHPIVKHTQPAFFSLCNRRGFMPITKQQA